jgi:uncharacterized protein (DUF1778 family)
MTATTPGQSAAKRLQLTLRITESTRRSINGSARAREMTTADFVRQCLAAEGVQFDA